jgi:hypothetical protein
VADHTRQEAIDEYGFYPPDRDGIQFQGNPNAPEIKGVELLTRDADGFLTVVKVPTNWFLGNRGLADSGSTYNTEVDRG